MPKLINLVTVKVKPVGDHLEADVMKYGFLVDRLSIAGTQVKEIPSGIGTTIIDLITNIN